MRRSAAPSKIRTSSQFVPPIRNNPIKRSLSPEDDSNRKMFKNSFVDRSSDMTKTTLSEIPAGSTRYFFVMWCKLSNKKHKTWEGDALLMTSGRTAILKDLEGVEIGRASGIQLNVLNNLEDGSILPIGGKEIEIQSSITVEEYNKKRRREIIAKIDSPVMSKPKFKPFRLPLRAADKENYKIVDGKPLYDINNPSSVVLPKPPAEYKWKENMQNVALVDVVIDPFIGSKLRPHQKTGVSFLYETIMSFRLPGFNGCILADEMGMGKSLQCISLIWTLLRQGPFGGKPVVKKALVVTPSSLTANWKKEFEKWLGCERINVYVVDQQHKIEGFQHLKNYPVLIISYEMLVRSIDSVKSMNFDILFCDEGHRLKNIAIKTTSLLNSLPIKKRVLITGTPIQNDLQELYALVEFVNPGILGTASYFRKTFEDAIVKSKQPNVSVEAKEFGDDKAYHLNKLLKKFTIRRTQEMLNKYLPPKNEYVVFCKPMEQQCHTYEAIVQSRFVQQCIEDVHQGDHLVAINALRKVCNHPLLMAKQESDDINLFKMDLNEMQTQALEENSGKLAVLSCMLNSLQEKEKVVIVSNFTTTLDILQDLCGVYNYSFLRLDGSTPTATRLQLVNRFNTKSSTDFILLLSAKAGGVGLNLIGSSRIILYDIDWNPATDLQAMARIWRDGQKKEVHIYRLLLAGSIEEKIYQRQICKQGISGSIVDCKKNSKNKFSNEELKDLFHFDQNSLCLTHELMNCSCPMDGQLMKDSEQISGSQFDGKSQQSSDSVKSAEEISTWQHFGAPIEDGCLQDFCLEAGADFITFVFKCRYNEEQSSQD